MLTPEHAVQLKNAGLTAYTHNVDTSRHYYDRSSPPAPATIASPPSPPIPVFPTSGLPGATDILPGTGIPAVTDIIPNGVPFARSLASFFPPRASTDILSGTGLPGPTSLLGKTTIPGVTDILSTSGLPVVTDVLPSISLPGGVLPTTSLPGVTDSAQHWSPWRHRHHPHWSSLPVFPVSPTSFPAAVSLASSTSSSLVFPRLPVFTKYKEVHAPTAPHTEIDHRGNIVYTEAKRIGVRKLAAYVKEMATGTRVDPQVNVEKAQENIGKLWLLIKNEPSMSKLSKAALKSFHTEAVRSLGFPSPRPRITGPRQTRNRRTSTNTARPANVDAVGMPDDRQPFLSIQRKVAGKWRASQKLTSVYFSLLEEVATNDVTFKGQNALLTGVGKGSIGLAIVRGLLAGGARVIITTSSYSRATVEYYQRIYQEVGARGSTLTVVPLNAGSRQDVDSLVDYIYDTMQLDFDFVLPFAAILENGRQIDGIDDKSELAHRAC
ncbi:hypothetical protein CF319_g8303 [Tilletia indica]|nr:hypothetical protein CF319_g8303 [Tilletia indica]